LFQPNVVQCAMHYHCWIVRVSLCWLLFGAGEMWARVNLALYQHVTASSQLGTYAPALAVDGRSSNFHAYRTSDTSGPHWLELRFPRPITLTSAHVYSGLNNDLSQGGLTAFQIQIAEGSNWVTVPGSLVTGNTNPERQVEFSSAITTQRIRLYTTNNGSRVIREWALFGPSTDGGSGSGYPIGTGVAVNLGHQRPTLASTSVGGAYPQLAVDGYATGEAGWLASGHGQTLEIDLLADHTIGSVHLHSGTPSSSPLADFVLETLSGTTWQVIAGTAIFGNANHALAIPFTQPVTTSRIRLRTTGPGAATVRELMVFPPRSAPYPLGQDLRSGAAPTARWDDFSDSMWRLRNSGPDLRLAVVNGAVVFGRALDGVPAIEWQLLLNYRDGSYRIRHSASGLCLALAQLTTAADTPVVVETYSALPHQDWWVHWVSDTEFQLVNVYAGLALHPAAGSVAPYAPMVVRPPETTSLQRWQAIAPRHHPKKGLATTAARLEAQNTLIPAAWSYTWGRQLPTQFPFLAAGHNFNPMQWGNFNWQHGTQQGPPDLLLGGLQASALPVHLMGFNEPDKLDQANMSVEQALLRWPRLEALNVPLVSPAPANAFGGWLAAFFDGATTAGMRTDYTAVHWYANPNATSLINHLQNVYTTFGKPVWLTEFSAVRWSGTTTWTHADNYNFLAEFMWRAEALPWLKRYSLFLFIEGPSDNPNQSANDPVEAPRSNALRADGSLTPLGELYAGWDGVTAVVPNKLYHIHNRGGYQRLFNQVSTAEPWLVDPTNSSAGTQWVLVPGVSAATYRIVSTADGRPLAWHPTSGLGWGAPGQRGLAFDWQLVADQHGWFFIQHPQANQRLRHHASGVPSLAAATNTGDAFKWRFVVPAVKAMPPGFAFWAQQHLGDLAADHRLPEADPDLDGMPNLLEFVFGTNPLTANRNQSLVPVVGPPGTSLFNPDRTAMYFEFPWRTQAIGHSWQIRQSTDLADLSQWPVIESLTTTVATTDGQSVIRVELPLEPGAATFYRLEVE
jgi:hypothetical protein